LELVSGGAGGLLFSQCNVAWRSFLQAGFRVSEFCFFFLFCFVLFFSPRVVLAGKYSVWSAEDLPSMFGAGGQQAREQAAETSGSMGGQVVAWLAGG
jgi:hypothetical protein